MVRLGTATWSAWGLAELAFNPQQMAHQLVPRLQGKKRKDTVCIVLADDTVEEAKIRMNKARQLLNKVC